jgi:hypothetical protein
LDVFKNIIGVPAPHKRIGLLNGFIFSIEGLDLFFFYQLLEFDGRELLII